MNIYSPKNLVLKNDLSVMKDAIENDSRFINISNDDVDEIFDVIDDFYFIWKPIQTILELNRVYEETQDWLLQHDLLFNDFTFNVALLKILSLYGDRYKLKYFEDNGWFILCLDGQCIHD